jgi:hypothetical protein
MQKPASRSLHPRGVFDLGAVSPAGEMILEAIDSRGRRIAERVVPLGGDVDAEWEALERYLDACDPRRNLALIRAS